MCLAIGASAQTQPGAWRGIASAPDRLLGIGALVHPALLAGVLTAGSSG